MSSCRRLVPPVNASSRSTVSMTSTVGRWSVCSMASSSSSSAVADLAERLDVRSIRIQLFDSAAASSTAAIVVISFWKISVLIMPRSSSVASMGGGG